MAGRAMFPRFFCALSFTLALFVGVERSAPRAWAAEPEESDFDYSEDEPSTLTPARPASTSTPGLPADATAPAASLHKGPSRAERFAALAKDVEHLERESDVLKKVVKLVRPTVVHIEAASVTQSTENPNRRIPVEDSGSGFFVNIGDQHYVITNHHVIRAAALKDIKIKLSDGRLLSPSKTWGDAETDVAVLAVSGKGLVDSHIGDSSKLEIGDFILAIGSPFGLSHSVTFGIVSATGRRDLDLSGDVHFQDFLQIDAAINPGNSGGPLINLRGEVVGMNTAIATDDGASKGVGFSIPINMVMTVARQLVQYGTMHRAYLGVSLDRHFGPAEAASSGLPAPRGTRITGVTPNSPAEAGHLKVGDVILEFDGVRVQGDSHLPSLVSLTEVGKEVRVLVLRDHQEIPLTVKLSAQPSVKVALPAKTGPPAKRSK